MIDDEQLKRDESEISRHADRIGKSAHDAWIDAHVRNLSIDVVHALEARKKRRTRQILFGIPALAGALGIAVFVVLYDPSTTIQPTPDVVTEEFYLTEADLNSALVADITEEEAIDMLAVATAGDNDLLTESDIDILFKE